MSTTEALVVAVGRGDAAWVHRLRSAGTEVLVVHSAASVSTGALPEVLHWGSPLGDVDTSELELAVQRGVSPSGLDSPWPLTILPGEHDGWEGRPGLAGNSEGTVFLPRWTVVDWEGDDRHLVITAQAEGIALTTTFRLDVAGVLRVDHNVTNSSPTALSLSSIEATMPVADVAREVLDFSGRWTRERTPQRGPLTEGSRVRESRRGRTGHDSPFVLAVGTPGFSNADGEVWAVHLGWSGDSVYRVDALPEARTLIGAGPLLRSGEIELQPGEMFRTPAAVFVWSNGGLDGIAERFHRSVRARPRHPRLPRPVTLNTWEAVYFQHDLDRLEKLAHVASTVGVERFVLDDGWFRARRADNAGLGDWAVDTSVWPDGLHPLRTTVHKLGMEFGLWFEPEMVNPDSELARDHPEWLLQTADSDVRSWRQQYVLDVSRPEVFEYLLESISALVVEYDIDYIKWDQNRDIIEAVVRGRAHVHRHTEAVYDLLDALRLRHPSLEIESCASGGARVDLGILERTDRVWPSDTNDALERLEIERWTGLLLPPELLGSHIGPAVAHTTRRASTLGFRIVSALFGSTGIEWDITGCTSNELEELRDGIAVYRRMRSLLHSGRTAHPEIGDPGLHLTSVTAEDLSVAVVRIARTATGAHALPLLLRVPGLDADQLYDVAPVEGLRIPRILDVTPPAWFVRGQVRLTGAAIAALGVRLPQLGPGQGIVLQITRVGSDVPRTAPSNRVLMTGELL